MARSPLRRPELHLNLSVPALAARAAALPAAGVGLLRAEFLVDIESFSKVRAQPLFAGQPPRVAAAANADRLRNTARDMA